MQHHRLTDGAIDRSRIVRGYVLDRGPASQPDPPVDQIYRELLSEPRPVDRYIRRATPVGFACSGLNPEAITSGGPCPTRR